MKILGQDFSIIANQLMAVSMNLYSWFIKKFRLSEKIFNKSNIIESKDIPKFAYISISSAGGLEKIELKNLEGFATVGYNASIYMRGAQLVDLSDKTNLPNDLVVVKTSFFSINYAGRIMSININI